jgi:UMF1 family MFS transporter
MVIGTTDSPGQQADKRVIWAWASYDWANSAYTTLIVTFIYSGFFLEAIALDAISGTKQWSNAVIVTGLTVAILSPFLGAIADQGGHRKTFLILSTIVTVIATAGLYYPMPGQVLFSLTVFTISNIAFEVCMVFYNAYLPDLADRDSLGKVSGYGWALGYAGGFVAMLLAFFGFIQGNWFGLSTDDFQNFRATPVLVAIWFGLFSIPMFLWVKDPPTESKPAGKLLRAATRQLRDTAREIGRFRQIVRLLVARMLYNDGIVTVFAFGSIYAIGTFEFTLTEMVLWGLALNVSAGIGAFAMGYLDDRIGGKRTILLSIVGLCLGATGSVLTSSKAGLWVAAIFLGIFVGPNQSASRSLLARFVPRSKETEFFGFFAFSGKAVSFIGPWAMGVVTQLTGNQRWGVSAVLVLFVLGGLVLLTVDEQEGFEAAREA